MSAENLSCGVEPKDCHEGTGSAALLIAENEKASNQVEAEEQVKQTSPALLTAENSVSGVEIKAVHEGVRAASRREGSAGPVVNPEKWSHEAIVARSNMRPERMQKLKVAANSWQNPGFEFLQECWNDDPALVIVIKKLLAKFPQWGIACVDGVLIKWNG